MTNTQSRDNTSQYCKVKKNKNKKIKKNFKNVQVGEILDANLKEIFNKIHLWEF